MKCLFEAYSSVNGKKKKEQSIKTTPQSNRKSLKQKKWTSLTHIYMTTHFHWLIPAVQ